MDRDDADARGRVRAVFDRIIPEDGHPAVSDGGLFEHLAALADDPATEPFVRSAVAVVDRLEADAHARHGRSVTELDPAELDDLIAGLEWADREQLAQRAAEAYYGGADRPGARMVGFDAGPKRSPLIDVLDPVVPVTAPAAVVDAYDVVVVGAGAGGGVVACVAAEAGARVLLVERGDALPFASVGRDHLRNHRSSIFGHNTGPGSAAEVRQWVGRDGVVRPVVASHDPHWHNNAMTVGGGTRVYQGMAWRFTPTDFRMATTYGVPDESSLADWPVSYESLEPHYAWAETTLGVCGDGAAHPALGRRSAAYPMPPLPPNTEAGVLGAGAARLGLRTGPVPLLINSEPYGGRARCVRCGECVGFACPSGAKTGSFDSVIPRALATGNADLVTGTRVTEITVDDAGRVDGARLRHADGTTRRVWAGDVVVAAGAIESARLLLASRSATHPDGLGNGTDQVGRHLQGHNFVSAFGSFDQPVIDMDGPGVSIATCDLLHHNEGIVGGGVVANEIIKLPIVHWRWSYPPDAPRWGAAAKATMRDTYRRTSHLFGQVQEVPTPDNRVTLGDAVDDVGMPVVRLTGAAHRETLRTAAFVRDAALRWMEASGAADVWADPIPTGLTAGQHQAGTCRMGDDPATSVTDPDGRVHGHDNLWVADGSVHTTNGGVNPVLTIFALAHRTAGHVVGRGHRVEVER